MPIDNISIKSLNAGFSNLFFEDEEFAEEVNRLVEEFSDNILHAVQSLKKRKNISSDVVDLSKITVRVLLNDDGKVEDLPQEILDKIS